MQMSIIDISYENEKSAALSDLYPYEFVIDDVKCSSIAGFLRCLCINDNTRPGRLQRYELCSLFDKNVNTIEHYLPDWRKTQILYWNRKEIKRESEEYTELLTKAYDSLFSNNLFRLVLSNIPKDTILTCSTKLKDKKETLLTEEENIFQINRLIKKLDI